MKTILTPKRRQLTKKAQRELQAVVDQWFDGSSGTNAMAVRSIKRGMIYRCAEEIAKREDRIPSGIIKVPPRSGDEGPIYCAVAGFEVDLDKLKHRIAVK